MDLFEDGPEGAVTDKTDADGKFRMVLKQKTKYALFARSERTVLRDTEKYYWLLWVTLDGNKPKRIMLSNDNLFSAFPAESVVKKDDLPQSVP
jgi:hypothetical protein